MAIHHGIQSTNTHWNSYLISTQKTINKMDPKKAQQKTVFLVKCSKNIYNKVQSILSKHTFPRSAACFKISLFRSSALLEWKELLWLWMINTISFNSVNQKIRRFKDKRSYFQFCSTATENPGGGVGRGIYYTASYFFSYTNI